MTPTISPPRSELHGRQMTKTITIMTPCYNEEGGIRECYEEVKSLFDTRLPGYRYEHLFIDNCSEDRTVEILREIAAADRKVKVIVNSRNFGHVRSPYYGLMQAEGDAVVPILADLQTPPELIVKFIEKWEAGYLMVLGVRVGSEEGFLMRMIRQGFYRIMARLSDVRQIQNFIGFGLYDRRIMQILREFPDPSPYFRGMVSEIGFEKAFIEYHQPSRKHGQTHHSFTVLLDLAIVALTSYSKVPLRLMTIVGLTLSGLGLMVALVYLILKLMFWYSLDLGIAPLLIGTFFFASVQLFCIGLLGEYVGAIFEHLKRRPLVIEKERINFD
jgi:polyisoprenyl-phosphate glycosyltransferase